MARTYSNLLSTAPTFTPHDARTYDVYSTTHTDNTLDGAAWTVPAGVKCVLDYRPQRGTLALTIATVAASIIEWPNNGLGAAPASAGTVAVNYLTGAVWFHADDVGKAVAATYKHLGSVLDAGLFNALQTAAYGVNATAPRTVALPTVPGVWSSGAPTASIYLAGNGRTALTMVRVWVSADYLPATGTTTFYVTTAATPTGGLGVSLLTSEWRQIASGSVSLDIDPACWLNVYCTAFGGHQNFTIGVEFA